MDARRCPTCGKPAGPRRENETFPFCSKRCRTLDLGKWLDERYRVPDLGWGDDMPDDGTTWPTEH